MVKRIVFFDIDGTLTDVPRGLLEPSDLTKYAIKELMNKGVLVFIASGRFKENIPQSIRNLNPNGYILSNGSYIEYQGEVLFEKVFDTKVFNEISDYCKDKKCVFFGETQETIYTHRLDDKLHNFMQVWNLTLLKPKVINNSQKFYKAVVHFDDRQSAIEFETKFNGLVDCRIQTFNKENTSYDINVLGINKGVAVEEVLKRLGVDRENVYCFCDGSNDIELAKACKNSYALSNGDEELKKITYGIADDVINDGVYHKLVEIGLVSEKK